MKLSTFEEEIDPVILKRGLDYHRHDRIKTVQKQSETAFDFLVSGAKTYDVSVRLKEDQDTIEDTRCSCPYDMGPYCKHEAAVFYYLLENKLEQDGIISYEDLRLRLSHFYKNELIGMLIEQMDKYPAEKEHLLSMYFDKRSYPDTTYIKREVRGVIDHYFESHPEGISHFHLMDLTDDLGELVDTARRLNGLLFYFDLTLYMYTEILIVKTLTKDTMGSINALLIYLLRDIKTQFTHLQGNVDQSKRNVFIIIENAMQAPVYTKQLTHSVILLNTFKDHLVEPSAREKYLTLIDQTIEKCLTENDKDNYDRLNEIKQYVEKWYE